MKRAKSRTLSTVLAFMSGLSLLFGSSAVVYAGDTYPYIGESAKGENQPYQHGYRVEDIMDWSPETDPYGELLRARVPLQERNETFAATQANPGLSDQAQYLTLTGDYGNAFFNSYPYTNEFSAHLFNFWQYVDYYASWHGMPSVGTPEELNDIEDERNATDGNAWSRRYFEFGLVNLPNSAYTNAAHKNGVLSLGCMFQPRAYQNFEVMLYQDENGRYPVADKMTELARYYGFDGYFFNMEGRSYDNSVRLKLREFLAQMREDGMYIQWYNAGSFSDQMLTDESGRAAANSVFIEYGHPVPGDAGVGNFDKFEVAFSGFEAGRDRFGNDFSSIYDGQGMNGSIASLGTDFVQTGLEQTVGYDAETGLRLFTREMDEYQWMAFERERLWWTGSQNTRTTVLDPGLTEDAETLEAADFTGVADYIAERSVINGQTFVTNFNTGHGLEYVKNGQVSSEAEWSNINLQDFLPTWQWWFETDGSRLSAEFDYGDELRKVYNDGKEGSFAFQPVGAYNGGSSLAVYGSLDAANFLHLYKTALDVTNDSRFSVTFRKTSKDSAGMKLGLIFESAPEQVVSFELENTLSAGGWTTSDADLSAYAGERIAVIGLIFEGNAPSYQMNLGQLKYTSGPATVPATPTGFTVEKAYETGEMILSWEIAPYEQVRQYNLYGVKDGKEIYLGGIYDETYYVKNLTEVLENDQVTFLLKAVSEDGTESEGASLTYDFGQAVYGISVDNATDGQLILSWEGGAADAAVTTAYEAEPRTWTGSGENGCAITVPTGADADGAAVTITLTASNGTSASVDSTLPDHYCAPYDGTIWSDGRLTQPSTSEWHILYYEKVTDGERSETSSFVRGGSDWNTFDKLSARVEGLYIRLEDYAGNISEEVYLTRNDSSETQDQSQGSGTAESASEENAVGANSAVSGEADSGKDSSSRQSDDARIPVPILYAVIIVLVILLAAISSVLLKKRAKK